jgi:hypothetical protein
LITKQTHRQTNEQTDENKYIKKISFSSVNSPLNICNIMVIIITITTIAVLITNKPDERVAEGAN